MVERMEAVPEPALNDVELDAGLEEPGGVAMPQRVDPARFVDPGLVLGCLVNVGAYILSLTGRFAGCRGPVLVAMRSPKSGFSSHGPLCYVRTD